MRFKDQINNDLKDLSNSEKLAIRTITVFFILHTAFISGCVISLLEKESALSNPSTRQITDAIRTIDPSAKYDGLSLNIDFGEP